MQSAIRLTLAVLGVTRQANAILARAWLLQLRPYAASIHLSKRARLGGELLLTCHLVGETRCLARRLFIAQQIFHAGLDAINRAVDLLARALCFLCDQL